MLNQSTEREVLSNLREAEILACEVEVAQDLVANRVLVIDSSHQQVKSGDYIVSINGVFVFTLQEYRHHLAPQCTVIVIISSLCDSVATLRHFKHHQQACKLASAAVTRFGGHEHNTEFAALLVAAGDIYSSLRKVRQAIDMFTQALTVLTPLLQSELHPDLAHCVLELSRLFRMRSEAQVSEKYAFWYLAILLHNDCEEKVLSEAYSNLAKVHFLKREYSQALELEHKVLAMRLRQEEKGQAGLSYAAIARIRHQSGDLGAEVEGLYVKAEQMLRSVNHSKYADTLGCMSTYFVDRGELGKAMEARKLEMEVRASLPPSAACAKCMWKYAQQLYLNGDDSEASELREKSIDILIGLWGTTNSRVIKYQTEHVELGLYICNQVT